MNISTMQSEIIRLKKEKDVCILAHSYQSAAIKEIADYTGDSFGLSVQAARAEQSTILMCGVRFMAETVKLLSPNKRVILANPYAGCPMAEQMDKDLINSVKEYYPDYTVVCYINTTSELKTICDVCVTSSSAVNIIQKIPNKKILFIPDCNLGSYIAKKLPEKEIKLLQGGCPIHARVSKQDIIAAKAAHRNAPILVHPECTPDVLELSDFVGSTTEIISFARNSSENEFIIGTEIGIAEQLSFEFPRKKFYPLSKNLICPNMKLTVLSDVFQAVNGTGGEEIALSDEIMRDAKRCIDKMIELG
ncbi:MAG: quinolinate synthase NadA [Clostridiales bacterium]|nr:quinolinate synthase NadA [Clostridiales bacterium]